MPSFELITPGFVPPLDPDFRPPVLANRAFQKEVADSGVGVACVLGLERVGGTLSRFETTVFPEGYPRADANLMYVERLVKFLLWQRGGWKVYIGGPKSIGEYIQQSYALGGARDFDYHFMGEQVYQHPFTVVICTPADVPPAHETGKALGRHLEGYRIGFDLGASDLKISAVVNGEPIFSEEIVWEPRKQNDPEYHHEKILSAIKLAASKMPRVDAIGGSSAGVYVDNHPMVASLFRNIPQERYDKIRSLFVRIREEMGGIPLEVINDGEVTALAGSMSLEDDSILGVALGSSEAAGYVTPQGNITDWLNELAFCPVDYQPNAAADEWSGDRGVGALYFSQQAVFRLCPQAGIIVPQDVTDADKLKFVQAKLEAGHEGAVNIWKSMGIYLGYTIAHYADFYELKHVLILGRVTSGVGGTLLLDGANEVLKIEFPALASRVNIQLPDEKSRRVGQSIAAASLPQITPEK